MNMRSSARRPGRVVVAAAVLGLALTGCASFGEGVTRALLDPEQETPDTRKCEITGPAFPGIMPQLEEQAGFPPLGQAGPDRPILKVLMVHGIGTHAPGYSGTLQANLSRALGLNVSAPQTKQFRMRHPRFGDTEVGTLTISRFANEARTREMLFYELTWSSLSAFAKEAIAYDDTETYARQRATLNRTGKTVVNDISPDPLVYVGIGHEQILGSVQQSLCWMLSTTWDGVPTTPIARCNLREREFGKRLGLDPIAIITHSLGSRIALDALQTIPVGLAQERDRVRVGEVQSATQDLHVPVYMLSNQLPLLQSGFGPPEVADRIRETCTPGGAAYATRAFASTTIAAFSDPNDVASYPITDEFVRQQIDSRLCPVVTNVTLNVAPVSSLFGAADLANPLTAHSGYEADERVIAMVARGIGQPWSDPIVRERCLWNKTDERLR